MSIEFVRAELQRFVASPEAEVLCIKGKWGVGKTYAWTKFLEDLDKATVSFKRYSYVSLFGLISYLSEQRRCKVCLILNEDAFGLEERAEFDRFFEKTIDAHIVFAPTARQCLDIGLPAGTPLNDRLRPYCLSLDISNIRVL